MDNFRYVIKLRITVAKVGQSWPESKDYGGSFTYPIPPSKNVLGQVVDILEPENRKVGQDV